MVANWRFLLQRAIPWSVAQGQALVRTCNHFGTTVVGHLCYDSELLLVVKLYELLLLLHRLFLKLMQLLLLQLLLIRLLIHHILQ